eukprot:6205261-Pleurochrysis_carterae.AAC.3
MRQNLDFFERDTHALEQIIIWRRMSPTHVGQGRSISATHIPKACHGVAWATFTGNLRDRCPVAEYVPSA